jgi:hypothetical protein
VSAAVPTSGSPCGQRGLDPEPTFGHRQSDRARIEPSPNAGGGRGSGLSAAPAYVRSRHVTSRPERVGRGEVLRTSCSSGTITPARTRPGSTRSSPEVVKYLVRAVRSTERQVSSASERQRSRRTALAGRPPGMRRREHRVIGAALLLHRGIKRRCARTGDATRRPQAPQSHCRAPVPAPLARHFTLRECDGLRNAVREVASSAKRPSPRDFERANGRRHHFARSFGSRCALAP